MSGAAAPAPKPDELQPHPVKEQLPNIAYCVTSPPPWPEAILLGFQHFLVMLGTTVIIPTSLVPQIGGGNEDKARLIQTSLFVAGINTLLQTIFGSRVPAVIGGSYAFVPPTISIIMAGRFSDILDPEERFRKTIRATQGALIIASAIQIILGFSGLWRNVVKCVKRTIFFINICNGLRRLILNLCLCELLQFLNVFRYLSPLSAVPLITLVGFGLYEHGFPAVAKCIEVGLPELVLLVFFTQYTHHIIQSKKPVLDRFAILFSVAIVWFYAFILTIGGAYRNAPTKTQQHCRTDRSGIVGGSPWIRVPYPFQWGRPTFDAGECFAMMAAAFVAIVESTGAIIAISRTTGATHIPPSIVSRGIGWEGIGVLLDGIFGTGNGSTVSVENAGLLVLTRVGSRRVVQIAAGFMIFFSVLGKFGAVFASIPLPIIAAVYCLLFAYLGSLGFNYLQFCNLNNFRTKFILGFSIFLGLSVPQYFNEFAVVSGYGPVHTKARWFNDIVNVIFSSEALVAGFMAYVLDNTIHTKQNRKDRGAHFWEKYQKFNQDPRSEEFYGLPFNLNRFFPSY